MLRSFLRSPTHGLLSCAVGIGLAGATVLGACGASLPKLPLVSKPSFYSATPAQLVQTPGSIIKVEQMQGAPEGAVAWRVLYRSESTDGTPIAVSEMVIVPQAPPPPGGRPVIAWAHPTTGVVPRCAPTLSPIKFMLIPGLHDMIRQGYVVTATDYPGLGTTQQHPFLIGDSEARSVLDGVRAAIAVPGSMATRRFAVWGHSQGGQAALFTGSIAASYAPDLTLVGVAAAAPATDLARLMSDDIGTPGGNNLTAMTLYSWSRLYGIPLENVVQPQAIKRVQTIANECVGSIGDSFQRKAADRALAKGFLSVPDLTKVEPWRSIAARNSAPVLPRNVPVFLAQGSIDEVVHPAVTRDYMTRLCRAGSRVAFDPVPNVGHGWVGMRSASATIAWIGDRFAGVAAPSNCYG